MLKEILTIDKIILSPKTTWNEAIEKILTKSNWQNQAEDIRNAIKQKKPEEYSYIAGDVVIPHLRIDGLKNINAILFLAKDGVAYDGKNYRLILFLLTPSEETVAHLKLLQGLSSMMPAIQDELLGLDNPETILAIIAKNEETGKFASYLNLTQKQIEFELQTNSEIGLSTDEAISRLEHYGQNLLKKTARIPWYVRLFTNFFSFFAILLWMAAGMCFIPGVDMPQLGDAIFIVIILNGIFSFLQEYKSDKAVEALQKLIAQSCNVFRDGRPTIISAADLVPGDIINLEEGDIVPADARLVEAYEVEVDNSALTGESNSVRRYKTDQAVIKEGKFLWIEMPNIVFAGSSLIRGNGKAIVFGTGMQSEIGKIAKLTQDIKSEKSPLQKQLRTTVFAIAVLAFSLALVFLFLGWLVAGLSFIQAFIFFIGLFVANVPEGLLPTVTLSLAMGVSRMAKRNAIVKDLASVETLGCTTVICSDKTGTLTQNLMMVTKIYVDNQEIEISGVGYGPHGEFQKNGEKIKQDELYHSLPAFRHLVECAFVCNNAKLDKSEKGYKIIGDPTEGALVTFAARANFRGTHQRIHLNPFESVRKRMSVVVRLEQQKKKLLFVKGAPLEMLSQCNMSYSEGELKKFDQKEYEKVKEKNDELANKGLRVLALAYRDDDELQSGEKFEVEDAEKNLVFLGLVALSDPVRPGVGEAIASCHKAGIRIIMITGDYALTAASIGRQIGLGAGGELKAIAGTEIDILEDAKLKEILLKGETIFARVSPEQKLRIVTLLKELGEIVAVTGDGVNDGPALKKADIGIAMGMRGTDVAKEAARIILTDDNFTSIVAAIEEGRAIFENIKRFSAYVFSSNPQEIYPYIFWMIFPGMPLSMTVMGVLAVDVGTDLVPAMGLGIEPPESGIMTRPPRKKNEKLLSMSFILRNYFVQGSILAFACYATYLYFGYSTGLMTNGFSFMKLPSSPEGLDMTKANLSYLQSLTAFFFPTVTTQIANVLSRRSYQTSLFGNDFIRSDYRKEIINGIRSWKPAKYSVKMHIEKEINSLNQMDALKLPILLVVNLVLLPFKYILLIVSVIMVKIEKPVLQPLTHFLAGFLEKNYIILNIFSNPLINLGIIFELVFSFLLFYSPLSEIYYFAPVSLDVYLFAFNGTILLLIFEETKKYYRRRGRSLSFLG